MLGGLVPVPGGRLGDWAALVKEKGQLLVEEGKTLADRLSLDRLQEAEEEKAATGARAEREADIYSAAALERARQLHCNPAPPRPSPATSTHSSQARSSPPPPIPHHLPAPFTQTGNVKASTAPPAAASRMLVAEEDGEDEDDPIISALKVKVMKPAVYGDVEEGGGDGGMDPLAAVDESLSLLRGEGHTGSSSSTSTSSRSPVQMPSLNGLVGRVGGGLWGLVPSAEGVKGAVGRVAGQLRGKAAPRQQPAASAAAAAVNVEMGRRPAQGGGARGWGGGEGEEVVTMRAADVLTEGERRQLAALRSGGGSSSGSGGLLSFLGVGVSTSSGSSKGRVMRPVPSEAGGVKAARLRCYCGGAMLLFFCAVIWWVLAPE